MSPAIIDLTMFATPNRLRKDRTGSPPPTPDRKRTIITRNLPNAPRRK